LFVRLWRHQASRGTEPGDLDKLAIGCAIFALGTAWLAAAPLVSGADGRAPLLWAVAFHFISNIGWLYFAPIALALYASQAPASLRGTLVGAASLTVFVGSIASGRLGAYYETTSQSTFWLVHAAIAGAGGVYLVLTKAALRRLFDGATDRAERRPSR
jgi:POT family proton-dependent oligopeptide transporter